MLVLCPYFLPNRLLHVGTLYVNIPDGGLEGKFC
uniref:Uncharacterized protein n=1 Tax=Rhizophora mucronata TaxID=61149 RepID=A0A2P2N203_RHIMU